MSFADALTLTNFDVLIDDYPNSYTIISPFFLFSVVDGTETVIRSCALTSLDSMCGMFELEGVRFTGCVMSCNTDACNGAHNVHINLSYIVLMTILIIYMKS